MCSGTPRRRGLGKHASWESTLSYRCSEHPQWRALRARPDCELAATFGSPQSGASIILWLRLAASRARVAVRTIQCIVVRVSHRAADLFCFAHSVSGPKRMIEYQNPLRAGILFHQLLRFRIVNRAHILFIEEVFYSRFMFNKDEPFALERELVRNRAAVSNGHPIFLILALTFLIRFDGADTAIARRFIARVDQVIEQSLNGRRRFFDRLGS